LNPAGVFDAMPTSRLRRDVITFNAAISANEKGGQWQRAVALFQETPDFQTENDGC